MSEKDYEDQKSDVSEAAPLDVFSHPAALRPGLKSARHILDTIAQLRHDANEHENECALDTRHADDLEALLGCLPREMPEGAGRALSRLLDAAKAMEE